MLEFLQDFYFSLYISTWTSLKWLLFSVLIGIACFFLTLLFSTISEAAETIWFKFSLSLTGLFALFCLFMTLHGIVHSIGILVGAVSSFFFPVFGLLIICGIILFIISLFNPFFLLFLVKK